MPKTPNGYPVIAPGDVDELTTVLKVGGASFRVAKAHAASFKALLTFLDAVEPFAEPGWDGGYAHRLQRGSSTKWSEHAAGTAIDTNASQHPMGGARYGGWTADQVRVIRWYLKTSAHGRRMEWGADFDRPDPMHFQLKAAA